MKKLLSILTLSLFLFEVSAQTKVAYCDVYVGIQTHNETHYETCEKNRMGNGQVHTIYGNHCALPCRDDRHAPYDGVVGETGCVGGSVDSRSSRVNHRDDVHIKYSGEDCV